MVSEAPPPPDKPDKVSRQAMNKIVYKITMIAQEECAQAIEDFNLCAKGRAFSMLWACRGKYHSSQDCIHRFVNDDNIDMVKRRWFDAGRPMTPNWDDLLKGIREASAK